MLGFLKFLKKRPPLHAILYHGSPTKQTSLSLPKKYDKRRGADGHAIYLSNSKKEAESYGGHLHKIHLHLHPHELMQLDRTHAQQHPEVRKKLEKIAKKHNIPLDGHGDYSQQPTAEGTDLVHRLGEKFGYEKASQEFLKHGIVAGVGESITGSRRNPIKSKVYSVYDPSRTKVGK